MNVNHAKANHPNVKPQQVTQAGLEQRIANEQRQINHQVDAGRLTPAEAEKLKAKLSEVQKGLEADAFDGNGLTNGRQFNKALNGVAKEIRTQSHDGQSNLTQRVDFANQSIDRALASGSISQADADKLKAQVATAKQKIDGAKLGGLTPEERTAANKILDHVDHQINRAEHGAHFDPAKRIANFEARIKAGVADGSLSEKEAANLNTRLTTLKNHLAGANLDGKLDPKERQALAKQLNGMSNAIFRQRHDADVNVPQRVSGITSRIDGAVQAGKLNAAQAQSLKDEMASVLKQYQGATDPNVQKALGARLNALNESLSAMLQQAPVPEAVI